MRHTPGPWTVISGSKKLDYWIQGPIVNEDEFRDICSLSTWDSDERIKANAHLIAAAPDLLEACYRAIGCGGLNHIVDTKVRKQVEAAIAKAEGRKQNE